MRKSLSCKAVSRPSARIGGVASGGRVEASRRLMSTKARQMLTRTPKSDVHNTPRRCIECGEVKAPSEFRWIKRQSKAKCPRTGFPGGSYLSRCSVCERKLLRQRRQGVVVQRKKQ